jgi:hypothetical protein
MKREEFQEKYHEWTSKTAEEATKEAAIINNIGIEGGKAIAVQGVGCWLLMLEEAVDFLRDQCNIDLPRR